MYHTHCSLYYYMAILVSLLFFIVIYKIYYYFCSFTAIFINILFLSFARFSVCK